MSTPTPGLLFVSSHLLPSTKVTDTQYNTFYNEEHLPDVLASGIHGSQTIALRYKNVNPSAPDPYIALYPLEDVTSVWDTTANTFSSRMADLAHANIAKSLGNIDINTVAAFTPRVYEKIQTYEAVGHERQTGKERGETIVCVAMEPGEGEAAEQDFDEWYRNQHLDMLGMCRGYRRCTNYKRMDGQSPRFLALHEYVCKPEELPEDQVQQVVGTEWTKKILGEAKVFEREVLTLIYVGGNEELKL